MKKEQYSKWLEGKINRKSAGDRISRCKSVEIALGVDLDVEFDSDRGQKVLDKLAYGQKEVNAGIPIPEGFTFKAGANVVQRITDLRSAVKNYFKYRENN